MKTAVIIDLETFAIRNMKTCPIGYLENFMIRVLIACHEGSKLVPSGVTDDNRVLITEY